MADAVASALLSGMAPPSLSLRGWGSGNCLYKDAQNKWLLNVLSLIRSLVSDGSMTETKWV